MSFLNAVINKVEDVVSREYLQERVEIVQHKIKFMDRVTVVVLDTRNMLSTRLAWLIDAAGGELQDAAVNARIIIYYEDGVGMLELMGTVPALLQTDWPSVTYNRVYLLDDLSLDSISAERAVDVLEDLAELLHPGYFVFGNEGKTWVSFKTQ
jgi:ABC-type Fe3+-hydroxamate transport system substrate-binding protein